VFTPSQRINCLDWLTLDNLLKSFMYHLLYLFNSSKWGCDPPNLSQQLPHYISTSNTCILLSHICIMKCDHSNIILVFQLHSNKSHCSFGSQSLPSAACTFSFFADQNMLLKQSKTACNTYS
jgi:hypothetical protein